MKSYSQINGRPSRWGLWSGKNFTRLALSSLLVAGGVSGCSPLRLLKPGQRLLSRVKVEGTEKADAERLQTLVQQKPNSTFPLPKVAIYQLGRSFYNAERIQRKLQEDRTHYDQLIKAAGTDSAEVGKLLTKRERHTRRHQLALDKGNAVMRLGEPPVIYDSSLTATSVDQLGIFLKSKGFFRSSVSATDTVPTRMFSPLRIFTLRSPFHADSQRVTVTYRIQEGPVFRYSQLDYDIADTTISRRVLLSQPQSLLRVGDQYDEEQIGAERSRLENLLKNQGFYDFRSQYITLEADTSFAPTTVRLRTMVAKPTRGEQHRLYTVRRVNFIADAGLVRFGQQRDTIIRDSVYYLAYQHKFSTKALDLKLAVRPGDAYSLSNTQLTQRQLSGLDMFRFSTVTYRRVRGPEAPADSARGLLDATVNASPAKKFQETSEFGATSVAERIGPFGNVRLKVRNVFGGAEILEFGLRAGFEGQYSLTGPIEDVTDRQSVLTTQLGANVNLVLPQFLVPWRANRFLSQYNPRTRFNATYTYVYRPEYTRTNAEGTFDYIWQRSAFHQFVLTPVDVSIIRTADVNEQFATILQNLLIQQGSPLYRSFDNLFIPSFNATSIYNSNDFNQTRDGYYLRLFGELGGLTRSLYQKEPLINNQDNPKANRLKTYDFAKFTADYRRYYKLGPNSYFVYRLAAGAATALTSTRIVTRDETGATVGDETAYLIPYDKYLFAGGSSSVRAWKPRRLGPGSATQYKYDPAQPDSLLKVNGRPVRDYNLEQPGELLLEGNVEFRFPLYSFIKGAVFTDFGNVWTLRSQPINPNQTPAQQEEQRKRQQQSTFRFNNFYRQFAVGSGIGFRFDFTFLILRLDVATKVYDPTAPGSKWAIRKFSLAEDQTAFNLGIGYPF
ncbi:translocation and assembly module lipoprotein TamL [Hymenobacter sublimis]|uniref:BamA/TamA family outer membrane protein n=1 Tax=Hymenobacter sublimis TaxID=2933777 RepID=A0ABY4JDR3_9BACT|nr:BamA/TamA family outer membrane protein [Hymenobacter sublimis]UPL50977.1 BamA/TamA family outer membrane protein [Hymenobacter sublimis]